MKSIIILIANCIVVLYSILFFIDNRFWPRTTNGKVWNILLLCLALYVCYDILYIYILKKNNIQSGLIYNIAAFVQKTVHSAQAFIQPVQKEFFISLIAAAVIIIISLLLVGLPGALLLSLLQKIGIGNNIQGDNVWPTAILLSIVWPFCFPAAVLVKRYFVLHRYSFVSIGYFTTIFIWVVFWTTIVILISGKTNA
jgi:hypothetical protein